MMIKLPFLPRARFLSALPVADVLPAPLTGPGALLLQTLAGQTPAPVVLAPAALPLAAAAPCS